MSMVAWGSVIAGVGAAAGGGLSLMGSNKASKAAKSAASAAKDSAKAMERIRDQLIAGSLFGLDSRAFTGRKPEFADFERLEIGPGLQAGARGQLSALPDLAALVHGINSAQTLDDAVRFDRLVPGGLEALAAQGQAAQSLSRGELPFDDALKVVRDRAGFANQLGLGGTQFASALPRDLGLSRLQAIQTGASLTGQAAQTANQINPIAGQTRLGSQFLSGPQTLDFQNQQNLLSQASQQNRYNLEAAPDPLAQGLLGLEMQRLQMRSSGQLAAAQIGAANATATAQQQQQAMAQIGSGLGDIFSSFNTANTTGARNDLIGALTTSGAPATAARY